MSIFSIVGDTLGGIGSFLVGGAGIDLPSKEELVAYGSIVGVSAGALYALAHGARVYVETIAKNAAEEEFDG